MGGYTFGLFLTNTPCVWRHSSQPGSSPLWPARPLDYKYASLCPFFKYKKVSSLAQRVKRASFVLQHTFNLRGIKISADHVIIEF